MESGGLIKPKPGFQGEGDNPSNGYSDAGHRLLSLSTGASKALIIKAVRISETAAAKSLWTAGGEAGGPGRQGGVE